jgi:hypothetical protein
MRVRANGRLFGIVLEKYGYGKTEAGKEISAVKLLPQADHFNLLWGGVHVDLGLIGIDHPHGPYTGIKVVVKFLLNFIS